MLPTGLPDLATEDELLARARRGSDDAIMQIYEHYFPPIYRYVRLRVGDRFTAEDLASEVFIKLVDALRGQNAPRHSLRGWLFKVARNLVATHYSHGRQLPTEMLDDWLPLPADEEPEAQFIHAADREAIRYALHRLAPEQQEALILRFGERLSLQETAEVMGKSVSAVKSLQFRALNSLRQRLGQSTVETSHE